MARRTRTKTAYPGVFRVQGGFTATWKALDPKTGRWRQFERTLMDARTAAQAAKRRDQLRDQTHLVAAAPPRWRLDECATSWIRSTAPSLKRSTRKTYAEALDLSILPAFGDWYIDAIGHDDIVAWRDSLSGGIDTRNGRLRVFRTMMQHAVVHGRTPRNPAADVPLIRKPQGVDREGKNCLSAEELRRFLDHAERLVPQWLPIFTTLALTGARFGAVSALRWDDIDIEANRIEVRRAQWHQHIDSTKTGVRRVLPLHPILRRILLEHRRRLLEAQAPGMSAGWVFPSQVGSLLYPASLRKPLDKVLSAAGIKRRFTVNGFRHTFNDLVRRVAQGEVVRAMTGHSTTEMSWHYSHVDENEKKAAVGRLVHLLGMDAGVDAPTST